MFLRNDAGNSRIPYRDPPKGLGDDIVGNSRIFVIASEAKQSLEILKSSLGNSKFILRNSKILLAFRLDKSSLQIL